jgi:hypothetical protein
MVELNKRRKLTLSILGLLAVSVGTLLYVRTPKPLENDCRNLLQAALRNDPDTVFSYSSEAERAAVPMSPASFRAAWAKLIAPRLALYKPSGSVSSSTYGSQFQSTAEVGLVGPKGQQRKLTTYLFSATEKGKGPILTEFLVAAWALEHYSVTDKPYNQIDSQLAKAEGAAKDKETLEQLGMHGLFTKPGEPIVTWDEIVARCNDRVRDMQLQTQKRPPQ